MVFPRIISWTFIFIRPGFFLTTPTLHPLLVATLRFDNGRRFPMTKGEEWRSLIAECSYRWAESREGGLKHRTGQGYFRLRHHPSHHDPGELSSLLRQGVTGSHTARASEVDYVELGLSCADICRTLERGMDGKRLSDPSQSVCDAISQLTTWVGPADTFRVLPLSMLPIAGLSWKYKGRSSSKAVGIESLNLFM